MSTIVTRSGKGSDLTPNEADQNIINLNADKLEKGTYATNNAIVIKNNSGVVQELIIPVSRILGRKATGEIVPLTMAEVIVMLDIQITDVDGLQAELDAKIDESFLTGTNKMLFKDNSGALNQFTVELSRLVGRKATGEIGQLTVAEVKTLLGYAIADITGLATALTGKSDTGHTHTPTEILGPGDTGWTRPTGKTKFQGDYDNGTVTLSNLAGFVSGIYDALKARDILD